MSAPRGQWMSMKMPKRDEICSAVLTSAPAMPTLRDTRRRRRRPSDPPGSIVTRLPPRRVGLALWLASDRRAPLAAAQDGLRLVNRQPLAVADRRRLHFLAAQQVNVRVAVEDHRLLAAAVEQGEKDRQVPGRAVGREHMLDVLGD